MIGVLVSGEGSNLQALLDAGLPVVAVASNRPGARALERAEAARVATGVFSLDEHADRDARDAAMADWLARHGVELVVCAGYMHLLTPKFLARFPGRVVNVHPAPLPDFPGAHPLEDLLAAGAPEAAATVHYVDDGVDSGPVIASERVPVLAGDTVDSLRERVHEAEHRLLPKVVRAAVRALISVYDKTGLAAFARGLVDLGFELVASGGTAAALADEGLRVTSVEEVTGFPELLDGRVKTLHPRIHAGILARRSLTDDLEQLTEQGIEPFDLVCVNLYPFEAVADRPGMADEDVLEMIDVGGPAMLRARRRTSCA